MEITNELFPVVLDINELQGMGMRVIDDLPMDKHAYVEIDGMDDRDAFEYIKSLLQDSGLGEIPNFFKGKGTQAPEELSNYILDLDEIKCQLIQQALIEKAKRVDVLKAAIFTSQEIKRLIRERKELELKRPTLGVWTLKSFEYLTKKWHRKWCDLNLAIDEAKTTAKWAWSYYKGHKTRMQVKENECWERYKAFMASKEGKELTKWDDQISRLRSLEINRYMISGSGSDSVDLRWESGTAYEQEIDGEHMGYKSGIGGIERLPCRGWWQRLRASRQLQASF